jgi:hypothetical protein
MYSTYRELLEIQRSRLHGTHGQRLSRHRARTRRVPLHRDFPGAVRLVDRARE